MALAMRLHVRRRGRGGRSGRPRPARRCRRRAWRSPAGRLPSPRGSCSRCLRRARAARSSRARAGTAATSSRSPASQARSGDARALEDRRTSSRNGPSPAITRRSRARASRSQLECPDEGGGERDLILHRLQAPDRARRAKHRGSVNGAARDRLPSRHAAGRKRAVSDAVVDLVDILSRHADPGWRGSPRCAATAPRSG